MTRDWSARGIGIGLLRPLVAVVLMLACAPQVHADEDEEAPQEQVLATLSRDQLNALMVSEGYSVTTDEDGNVVWKIEGFKATVFVGDGDEWLQFHTAFSDGNATLKKVNDWNRTKRYSRSYLDDEGDPHLELDLDLAGGVTVARITDFLKTCRVSFVTWHSEVVK